MNLLSVIVVQSACGFRVVSWKWVDWKAALDRNATALSSTFQQGEHRSDKPESEAPERLPSIT